jgi:hypothetical protein
MTSSPTPDSFEGLNWSQQRALEQIAPQDRASARAASRTAATRYREEAVHETTINGRQRLITSIRQTIGQCPFRESIDEMRALCLQLEAEITAAQR